MTEKLRKVSIDKQQEANFSVKEKNKLKIYQKVNRKLKKLRKQEQELQEVEKEELQNIENGLDGGEKKLTINLDRIQTPTEIQERLDKLNKNRRQLELLEEVSIVYQSYLTSILSEIKYKSLSQKDERYEQQIKSIQEKLREIRTILEDTTLLGLQNVNVKELVEGIFVSEEKIAQTGRLDHFFQNPEEVDKRYEEIKSLIVNLEKGDNVLETKLKIFELLRKNEGLDDNKHKYDSGRGIQRNLAKHILEHKGLREENMIKIYFQILEEIGIDETKKKRLEQNTATEQGLYHIMREFGIFLPKKETRETKEEIKEYKEQFNMKEKIKTNRKKILEEIEKHLTKIKNKEKKETEKQKWNNPKLQEELKNSLLEKLERIYRQEIYKIVEEHVINWQLEMNEFKLRKLKKKDKLLKIYAKIEGIGNKVGDKAYNNIVDKTEFIGTQIGLMYIAGIGQMGVKTFMSKGIETSAKLSAKQLATQSYILGAEGLAFYGLYELGNSLIYYKDKDTFQKEMKELNIKDWARMTTFLGILRGLPLSNMRKQLDKIKAKDTVNLPNLEKIVGEIERKGMNITLDTTALLGTDIIVKASFKEELPKTKEELVIFLQKELEFIIPLVIGLRGVEKIGKVWDIQKKQKFANNEKKSTIVVEIKDKKVIVDGIEIEVKGEVQKRIMEKQEKQKTRKEGEKMEKSDSPMKENSNWEIDMRAKKLGMEAIKLEEMMKGFELETKLEDGITERFINLQRRFGELENKVEIEQEVRKTIEEEINKIKGSLDTESVVVLERMRKERNIEDRLTRDFMEALEKRIRQEKFDNSYGEARFMERVMDLYVEEMNNNVLRDFIDIRPGEENKDKE